MNKEYTYIDGKVIVKDENGVQIPGEYYDNLDEVLVQENLVETMENRIKELEKESVVYQINNVKKPYIPTYFIFSIIIATIGAPSFMSLLSGTNLFLASINTIFGSVNAAVLIGSITSIVFLPLSAWTEYDNYSRCKHSLKKMNGINSEIEYLRRQIVVEKQKLVDLSNIKTRTNENKEFRVVKVNDLDRLKSLRSLLNLYYDLGYNVEKYYAYYQEGKLADNLGDHYGQKDLEVAKEFLEEKGPILVHRKK